MINNAENEFHIFFPSFVSDPRISQIRTIQQALNEKTPGEIPYFSRTRKRSSYAYSSPPNRMEEIPISPSKPGGSPLNYISME